MVAKKIKPSAFIFSVASCVYISFLELVPETIYILLFQFWYKKLKLYHIQVAFYFTNIPVYRNYASIPFSLVWTITCHDTFINVKVCTLFQNIWHFLVRKYMNTSKSVLYLCHEVCVVLVCHFELFQYSTILY